MLWIAVGIAPPQRLANHVPHQPHHAARLIRQTHVEELVRGICRVAGWQEESVERLGHDNGLNSDDGLMRRWPRLGSLAERADVFPHDGVEEPASIEIGLKGQPIQVFDYVRFEADAGRKLLSCDFAWHQ